MEHNDHKDFSVGVVGGGQLAKMLAIEGEKLGVNVFVQTGSDTDPAVLNAFGAVLSDTNDIDGTRKLASQSNCVTFENEWLDIEALSLLEDTGISFVPSLSSIMPLVNKLSQRILLNKLNIPVPKWTSLSSFKSKELILPSKWKFPIMAKSSMGGYDGKGTRVLNDYNDLSTLLKTVNNSDWYIEEWVDYKQELSIVVSRDKKGQVRLFPLSETFQSHQICDWVLTPADVSQQVTSFANNIAMSLVRELNYVGVLAVEFFYGDSGLLVNEIAPRTHNSAHLTIEACKSNQFEHQIAIAAELEIENPDLLAPGAMMVNLLGIKEEEYSISSRLKDLNEIDGLNIHWYNKDKNVIGRKLGHVTKLLNISNKQDCRKMAFDIKNQIRTIWPFQA